MHVLYEDNHLLAVNKAPSELVQGDKTGDASLDYQLKDYLKNKYNKPGNVYLGLTHRLDRPVSGVVLFGKTSKATARLNDMFKNNNVSKKYWALVRNYPSATSGTLQHYMLKNAKKNKSFALDAHKKNTKRAVLDYKIIARSDYYYLLEIILQTGRHHQIRSQLSQIGCPVRGDLKYGFPRSSKTKGIGLHAREISLNHPVKKTALTIIADPPEDNLWHYFVRQLESQE